MSESQCSTETPQPWGVDVTTLPPVVPIAMNSHIKVPLSSSDYSSWKAHVTALLNGFNLTKHVDSSIPPPPETAPEYKSWFQQDQLLLAAFIGSAEPDIRPLISHATTSAEAWLILDGLFSCTNIPTQVPPCRYMSQQDFLKLLKPHHPKNWSPTRHRQMHKVSHRLRMNQKDHGRLVYDPFVVSLGPYHHGRQELSETEEFKHMCLHWCADGSDLIKTRLYNRILGRIDEIRGSYGDVSVLEKLDDNKLALMMLLDSCFIFNFIENRTERKQNNWQNSLGIAAAIPFVARDIMVLENQIPFFVLKMLIDSKYSKEAGRELLQKFLSWMLSVDLEQAVIPRLDVDPPLHILEACWRVIAEDEHFKQESNYRWFGLGTQPEKKDGSSKLLPLSRRRKTKYHTCPPVTDLKEKGIVFRPSRSHSIKDITFKSYVGFGQLHLPVRSLSDQTQVILSNMIAYEVSPDAKTDLAVLSYTNFMKSLIETPEDVKELLAKGIFQFNRLANLERVVQLFNSIDTFGLENVGIYENVLQRMGDHCNSKSKTWFAELVHSKLQSPWTLIALLAAIFLVVLTFLQTYYTMYPVG